MKSYMLSLEVKSHVFSLLDWHWVRVSVCVYRDRHKAEAKWQFKIKLCFFTAYPLQASNCQNKTLLKSSLAYSGDIQQHASLHPRFFLLKWHSLSLYKEGGISTNSYTCWDKLPLTSPNELHLGSVRALMQGEVGENQPFARAALQNAKVYMHVSVCPVYTLVGGCSICVWCVGVHAFKVLPLYVSINLL